jgi:hypothetical protein
MHEREAPAPPATPLSNLLASLLDEAVKKAEAAAAKAEQAAVRPKYWLIAGFLLTFVGAVLAFALEESDPSVLGVSLQPFGGVLFAAGALMIAGAGIASIGNAAGGPSAEGIKSVGGLIAVVVGITAVTALTIVTLTKLGGAHKDSMVAVTSSAFGIISAVVGAYLGIKISSDTTAKAGDSATAAAVSQRDAEDAQKKLLTMTKTLDELAPEKSHEVKAAAYQANQEGVSQTDPPQGAG